MHIILLDNGRLKAAKDERLKEMKFLRRALADRMRDIKDSVDRFNALLKTQEAKQLPAEDARKASEGLEHVGIGLQKGVQALKLFPKVLS
jgi:hypothetical protein